MAVEVDRGESNDGAEPDDREPVDTSRQSVAADEESSSPVAASSHTTVIVKARPEDFEVTELPLYEPSGDGEHTYLWVEKRERTTDQVVGQLAELSGARRGDLGYAGRKDRRAVTRQWFSVPRLDPEQARDFELDGATVLDARRHRNKLRVGHLAGNRFRIVVRGVDAERGALAGERLAAFGRWGFANRFGEQRFGRYGDNARRGAAVLSGDLKMRNRRTARFLISALQSAVFNEVLAARDRLVPDAEPSVPGRRSIDRLVPGDLAIVHVSGGRFLVEDVVTEQERGDRLEISPTGPIFGSRMRGPGDQVAALEAEAMRRCDVPELERLPRGIRVDGTRRALRTVARDGQWSLTGDEGVLEVTLEPGVYATVLLKELFGDALDIVDSDHRPESG